VKASRVSYADKDSLFRETLAEGQYWERWLCDKLVASGVKASCPAQSTRKSFADRHQYADQQDLFIQRNGASEPLSVKGRKQYFTSRSSYPYKTAIVCEVEDWHSKPKPVAVALVSTLAARKLDDPRRSVLAALAITEKLWVKETRWDNFRQALYEFYLLPVDNLVTYGRLVEILRGRRDGGD
jgi:hypothetical protein